MWRYAEATLRKTVLGGAGDPERERFFRMCITACLHRGVTQSELRRLPQWWHDAPAVDLAGGPLEVLWSKGVPDILSAQPCAQPCRKLLDPRRPDLYLPLDCGTCPSCLARIQARCPAS